MWMIKRSFRPGMDLFPHAHTSQVSWSDCVLRLHPMGLRVRDSASRPSDTFFLPLLFQMYTTKKAFFWEVRNLCSTSL